MSALPWNGRRSIRLSYACDETFANIRPGDRNSRDIRPNERANVRKERGERTDFLITRAQRRYVSTTMGKPISRTSARARVPETTRETTNRLRAELGLVRRETTRAVRPPSPPTPPRTLPDATAREVPPLGRPCELPLLPQRDDDDETGAASTSAGRANPEKHVA